VSDGSGRSSRRGVLAPHAFDVAKLRRCPICQWAIEQDHADALAMHAARTPAPSVPARPPSDRAGKRQTADVMAFALV
jgi:hypothetical protein